MDFSRFQEKLRRCRICKGVIGPPLVWGDKKAKIAQISQAPSLSAIKNRRVWSDVSGERLRRKWYQISDEDFFNPKNFYITAIAHCFPGKGRKGGDKRPPRICAEKWLLKEISHLSPKLFIVIGKQAAEFLFPGKSYKELIFNDQKFNGTACLVLPHPSPANIAWFKDNPEFKKKRLKNIREAIHKIL